MTIEEQSSDFVLALPESNKREKVLYNDGKGFDTLPRHIQSTEGNIEALAILVNKLAKELQEVRSESNPGVKNKKEDEIAPSKDAMVQDEDKTESKDAMATESSKNKEDIRSCEEDKKKKEKRGELNKHPPN